MSVLPSSWVIAPLGAFTIDCGQRVPDETVEFKYIDIGSINRDTKRIETPQLLLGKDAPSRARKHVRTGDVLVSMTRPNLNAVALVPDELDGQIASTGFDVLRSAGIEPRWVSYLVRTAAFVEAMGELVQGALYPAVRPKDIRGFEAPLAPLNEQTRIADKLDEVLARVDSCRSRLDRVPVILKRFRQSVLTAATSGKLTEDWRSLNKDDEEVQSVLLMEDEIIVPKSWNILSLRDVIDPDRPLCYGVVQPGEERAGGVPLIRVQDMERGGVLTNALRTISSDVDAEYKRSRVVGGELLISVVGTIGRTAIVPHGLEANIARAVARVACRQGISSVWVNIWLSSDALQWWLTSSSKEVARKTLNLSDLATAKVAIPSVEEQTEIVLRVEALFAYADRLEARYIAARMQVEKLTPALLAKAFRGELVPQDPSDEPASELIERITVERALKAISLKKTTSKREAGVSMKPRNVIPIIEALRLAKKPLSAQALLVEAGYPTDVETELVERFFLDIRKELEEKRIERIRKGNDDFFSIVP